MGLDAPLVPIPMELPDLSTNPPWVAAETKEYFTQINDYAAANDVRVGALEAGNTAWTAWAPTWSSDGGAQPGIGNGTLTARYSMVGPKAMAFRITILFGSTSAGGTGNWSLTLPFNSAAAGEQAVECRGFAAGVVWGGTASITAGQNGVRPYLTSSQTDTRLQRVRNSTDPATAGTGIPTVAGVFPFTTGSNLIIEGTIEIA